MKGDKEKLFEKITKYKDNSFVLMSLIVSYHIVTPSSVGGFVMFLVLCFLIYRLSLNLLDRTMMIK